MKTQETLRMFRQGARIGIAFLAVVCAARANVIRAVGPDPQTGPPYYSVTGRLGDKTPFYFHDDQWAAFVFVRLPDCIPADFNLLDNFDPAGASQCYLTVGGYAIWADGHSEPQDIPIQVNLKGLGAVPVWFVKLTEVQAIIAAGNTLTKTQLLASPSLRKGKANVYEEVDLPGPNRPPGLSRPGAPEGPGGPGSGSTQVVASGSLDGTGVSFQLEWLDMGVKNGDGSIDLVRHARIAFK
jgi:hypothetical protein